MWLVNLLCKILPAHQPNAVQAAILTKINPDRFSADEVAALMKCSVKHARRLCETAVRRGEYGRHYDNSGHYYLSPG